MELTSRTVLITGGATGIGYALAKQFVANQNRVIICGRSQEKLDLAKLVLPSIETIRCDINCANECPAIIFTGSALGIVPKYEVPVYSAAKAGIHSFVQSLRHQSKQDGVRVHEIFPEVVITPMTRHRKNESMMDPDEFATTVIKQLVADNQNIYIGRTNSSGTSFA